MGGSLALLLAIAIVLARPASRAIKSWQARRHADKAFSLIAAEKWDNATREARAAYQIAPNEPDAIRAVARLLTRTRQPEALGFWNALREKGTLTRPDLRDEAAAALLASDLSLAQEVVKELLGEIEGGPRAADYLLGAQVAAQNGRSDEALALANKAATEKDAPPREQLGASILQLTLVQPDDAQDREIRRAAWSRLTNLARGRGRDRVALDALTILVQQTLSSPNEIVRDPAIMPAEELAGALRAHPLGGVAQKLLALDLEMHADPAKQEELIAQAISAWGKANNETLAVLARWLNGKGEFQRELDTIPLARALQTRDLFLQRLDALGALNQWAEVKRLLTNESFPLDPMIERMYLARCNQKLNEVRAGENNWQRAFEAAGGDPQKLLLLADYAEKNGATGIAARAYDTIVREMPSARPAQQGRLRLAQRSRDTRKIHAILREMLKQWPNDTAVQNDEAYLRLLMATAEADGGTRAVASDPRAVASDPHAVAPGSALLITNKEDLITVAQLAQRLVERAPASLPHRTLLALARLRLDQPAKALEVYRDIRVAPNVASPAAIAVHAAVLSANGELAEARAEAGSIDREQLLPEEAGLIEKL